MQKKDDPYLETREKEDAFVERIVSQVTEKILTNLPTLAGMYMMQQQAMLTAGLQNAGMPVMNFTAGSNECKYDGGWSTEGDQEYKKWDGRKSGCN